MPTVDKKYYHNIDLDSNELKAGRIYNLTTVQRSALSLTTTDKGYVVYDTTLLSLYIWNGTTWTTVAGGVSSLSATSPITVSASTGAVSISTSMSTNKLIGRSSTGTGVMEEISLGTGLSFSGTTLNNTATFTSPLTTKGDIYVRNSSVDTRLPIGLDTQILIADSTATTGMKWGSNTAATPTGYYGAWQDNLTQMAAVNNTGYAMIFRTIDISNGVTVVTNGTNLTRITFANTGVYNLQFSSQFQNTHNVDEDVTIWLRKNGTDVTGSSGFISVPSSHGGTPGHIIAGWNYLLNVIAGEYYELIWSTTDAANVTMQFYAAGSPPPSAASVILTVTQQSGIMAGTGITAINSLTGSVQTMVSGTSGTDFAISSTGSTHTFNLPTASSINTGKLSSADWSIFNNKQNALTNPITGTGTNNELAYFNTTGSTLSSLSTTTYPSLTELSYLKGVTSSIQTQLNAKQGSLTLTTTGASGAATFISNTLNVPIYTLSGLGGQPLNTNLTSLSGLSYISTSFVKMTAAGTFQLDTATYLTGNQTITLSGDITGSGTTAITTSIGANKVTNTMLAQAAANTIKGNNTGATANVTDLTATQVKTLLAIANTDVSGLGTMSTQNASGVSITGGSISGLTTFAIRNAGTGAFDMTETHNGTLTAGRTLTWNLNDAARTISLSGNLTVSSTATISGTNTGDQTITLTGDVTGSGTGSFTTTIANSVVTLAKMANLAANSILGNNTGVSATPLALTGTQVTAMLDNFTSTLKGLVPFSGGGTTNFLRADGTWAVPAGGGGGGSSALSAITAATAINTIDNVAYAQEWQWNSLAGGNGFRIMANTTAAASNTQTLFTVGLSGANATSTQSTTSAYIYNTHTGTSSSNTALLLSASGGTNNYALIVNGGRVGISQTAPTSQLQINFNQNSVTQSDANGILLANSSAATNGTQSISPPMVWQANGWGTTGSASQDVRFRMDVLPIQAVNAAASFQFAYSTNGSAYTNAWTYSTVQGMTVNSSLSISGTTTCNGDLVKGNFRAGGNNAYQSVQFLVGLADTTSQTYKQTNGGGGFLPRLVAWTSTTSTTSNGIVLDVSNNNGLVFTNGNGSTQISRAALNITNMTNTAGSETGDLIVLIQNAGAGMVERLRVSSTTTTAAGNLYCTGAITSLAATPGNANFNVWASNRISLADNASYTQFNGSTNVQYRTTFYGSTSDTVGVGNSYASVIFQKTPITIAASGTHNMFANAAFLPLNITTGVGSLTYSSNVFIDGASTGAVNTYDNYSLYIRQGDSFNGGYMVNTNHKKTTSDFTVTASTTLATVTGLSVNVSAGCTYKFRACLHGRLDTVGGQKFAISGSCTATSIIYQINSVDNVSKSICISSIQSALAGSDSSAGQGDTYTIIEGIIVVNAAGTLLVQFAEKVANGPSVILSGSSFLVERLS